MTILEEVERAVNARVNHERARAFGAPVLRSLHPDAVLVGYSVSAEDDGDVMVESNHVTKSSLTTPSPVSFTSRTRKSWSDADVEWRFHAMDHVTNANQDSHINASTPSERHRLVALLDGAERFPVEVSVDGVATPAVAFQHEGTIFARLTLDASDVLVTVAVPKEILEAGFSTTIPD